MPNVAPFPPDSGQAALELLASQLGLATTGRTVDAITRDLGRKLGGVVEYLAGTMTLGPSVTNRTAMALDAAANVYHVGSDNKLTKTDTAGTSTVLAGTSAAVEADGTGTAATFNVPHGVDIAPDGSYLLVVDRAGGTVRKVTLPGAVVTTLATGLSNPCHIRIDATATYAYITNGSSAIGRLTLADNTYLAAWVTGPADMGAFGVAYSGTRNTLGVTSNQKYLAGAVRGVYSVNIATQAVTFICGSATQGSTDGNGSAARFSAPGSPGFGNLGAFLYVPDDSGNRIARVDMDSGDKLTIIGDGNTPEQAGTGTGARVNRPSAVRWHAASKTLYTLPLTTGGYINKVV